MSRSAKAILNEALDLPVPDRLRLASELIASADGPPDSDWETAWLAELDRRLEAAKMRPDAGSEWPEVRARILARLAGS